jgi:hypothetical protein
MTTGGVLCEECRPGRRGVVSVSRGVIEVMQSATALAMETAGPASRSAALTIDPSLHGELRAVMNNYLAHLVGHRLKMSEYLGAQT